MIMCAWRILEGGSPVSDYFGFYFCDILVPILYKNQGISNTPEGQIASTSSASRKRMSSKERGIRDLIYRYVNIGFRLAVVQVCIFVEPLE